MSLLNNILPKKDVRNYLLILFIQKNCASAAIVQTWEKQSEIIGKSRCTYSDFKNKEDAIDYAVSEAEKNLPSHMMVEKVVYAIPDYYLEDNQIKPYFLKEIRKISQNLNLKPWGYIDYPAIISLNFMENEGAKPTLISLGVYEKYLSYSLIRMGKIQQNSILDRSASISSDFEKAISPFGSEILPSRIILYGDEEILESFAQELETIPWHKHISFRHTPKIEIFPSSEAENAIVKICATTLINRITAITEPSAENNIEIIPETENDIDDGEKIESGHHDDIHHNNNNLSKEDFQPDETFGFVTSSPLTDADISPDNIIQKKSLPSFSTEKIPIVNKPGGLIHISSFFHIVIRMLGSAKTAIFIIPVLILSFLFAVYILLLNHKAHIYLIVYPFISQVKSEIDLTTDAKKAEQQNNFLLAKEVSVKERGEKTATPTGRTRIGDKAKGEVTIYNKTFSVKNIPKNAVILNGNLNFALDRDVAVASASDTGEGIIFGKNNVPVTATAIGAEGNLNPGSSFIFRDLPESSFMAKNNQAFSGGNSQEVISVSSQDQEKLEELLSNEIVNRAQQTLSNQLSSGEKIIDSSLNKKTVSKTFSANIGSPVKEPSLNMEVQITALSYSDTDLSNKIQGQINSPPSGYVLDNRKTVVQFDNITVEKNNAYHLSVSVKAFFLPSLDLDPIKNKLVAKTYSAASSLFSEINQVSGIKIINDHPMPFQFNRLPYFPQNITLSLSEK